LEHFHIFSQLDVADVADASSATLSATSNEHDEGEESSVLDMHTDMGLFIIMTAAEYFGAAGQRLSVPGQEGRPETTGFLLELPGGEVVAPVIPEGCLLVMNGEGSSLWMQGSSAWPRKPQVRLVYSGRTYWSVCDIILKENTLNPETYTVFWLQERTTSFCKCRLWSISHKEL
jgi:hypothetical protein